MREDDDGVAARVELVRDAHAEDRLAEGRALRGDEQVRASAQPEAFPATVA